MALVSCSLYLLHLVVQVLFLLAQTAGVVQLDDPRGATLVVYLVGWRPRELRAPFLGVLRPGAERGGSS